MLTTMSNLHYDIYGETRFYYCQSYKRIYKFTMDTNLKLKLLKRKIPFTAQYPYKGTRKVRLLKTL